jgi:Uri superfamily endonuclease
MNPLMALEPLPAAPGTYALVLKASSRRTIQVGRLGTLTVEPGIYIYVGSARGPGGLAARVARHCRTDKSLRWHIDYLRTATDVEQVWYAVGNEHLECTWADSLLNMNGARVPLPRFGASDCECRSHLVWVAGPTVHVNVRRLLSKCSLDRGTRVWSRQLTHRTKNGAPKCCLATTNGGWHVGEPDFRFGLAAAVCATSQATTHTLTYIQNRCLCFSPGASEPAAPPKHGLNSSSIAPWSRTSTIDALTSTFP